VEVGIGKEDTDQREIGDRGVVHRDADLATHLRSRTDVDVGARQRAVRGPDRASGIGIDARGARRLPRRVYDAELVAHDEADLDDREDGQDHEWQEEGELDGGLAAFAVVLATSVADAAATAVAPGSPAPGTGEPTTPVHDGSTLLITVSNSCEIAWLPVAQVMSRVAIATAPRITSAYSAVD